MENNRFNRPNPESSSDEPEGNEASSGSSSSKKKKRANDLAKFIASQKSVETGETSKSADKDERSIWQKLLGEEINKAANDEPVKVEKNGKSEQPEAEPDDTEASKQEVADELERTDAEPPLEELSAAEQLAVAREYVEARLSEIEPANSDADPGEQSERTALADFLQSLRDKLSAPAAEQPEDLAGATNEAYAEAVQGMPGGEQAATDLPEADWAETAAEPDTVDSSISHTEPGIQSKYRQPDFEAARDFDPTAPIILNPTQHNEAGQVWQAPEKPAERVISEDESHRREARAQAKGVLAGGLVGYLIGRRHGRIKTEKRLQKVQTKLEKQVENVQAQVVAKEQQIRQLARRQSETIKHVNREARPASYSAKPTAEARPTAPSRAETAGQRLDPVESAPADRSSGLEYAAVPIAAAAALRRDSPVAERSRSEHQPGISDRAEVAAERYAAESDRPVRVARSETPAMAKRHEQMTERFKPGSERLASKSSPERPAQPAMAQAEREQLLNRSAEIRFGDTNLRRVYEARLVDEAGLRRMIQTHESGGDLRRALAREFLAKELRFERDPYLHGHDLNEDSQLAGQVRSRDNTTARDGTDLAAQTSQAQADNPADPYGQSASAARHSRTTVSPLLLWVLVIVTILLAIYAIWLTVTR